MLTGIETDCGLWASRWQQPIIGCGRSTRWQPPATAIVTMLSGAKSDAGDAKLLADLGRTDRHNHHEIAGDTPGAEAIKLLGRTHRDCSVHGLGMPTCCVAVCGRTTPQPSRPSTRSPTATRWLVYRSRTHS